MVWIFILAYALLILNNQDRPHILFNLENPFFAIFHQNCSHNHEPPVTFRKSQCGRQKNIFKRYSYSPPQKKYVTLHDNKKKEKNLKIMQL